MIIAKIIRPMSTGANKVIKNTTIAAIIINAITPMIIVPIVPNLIFSISPYVPLELMDDDSICAFATPLIMTKATTTAVKPCPVKPGPMVSYHNNTGLHIPIPTRLR
jgi:hypothetical protein